MIGFIRTWTVIYSMNRQIQTQLGNNVKVVSVHSGATFVYICTFPKIMKLNCSVSVINRFVPNLSSTKKHKNAVLAIMKPPKEDAVYLLLISSKNKSGARYKIRGNIEKTFGHFRSEGKTTIRFIEPPHDLCINADKIQLGNFMTFIKKVWNNEEKAIPEIHRLTVPQIRSQTATKMEIKTKSQYPVLQGFPSNLQILNINNCQLKRVDNRILKLKSLTVLCLDKNNLVDIPADLKKLPLKHLSLRYNKLGKTTHCWNFLLWPLSSTLEYLDLSGNEMKFFPATLSRFSKLKILKLSNISVNKIPFRICLLPNLQELDLSHNMLLALPGTITRRYKKFDKLDVSDIQTLYGHHENRANSGQQPSNYVPSLFECSVRSMIDNRIPYSESTLPQNVVVILDSVKTCSCGKTCSKDFGYVFTTAEVKSLANTFISSHHFFSVPILFHACCPSHLK